MRCKAGEKCFGLHAGGNQPPGDVPAALHQLKIVQRGLFCACGEQRLEQGVRRVVHKQHDMRQLKRSLRPDRQPRRHTLGDSGLGRPDGRVAAGGLVVGFQVERQQHTAARAAAAGIPFDQHEPFGQRAQHAFAQIVLHRAVDGCSARAVVCAQPGFGQSQPQAGGRIAHEPLCLRPVGRLGRELVARNDRKAGQVNARGGKQQLREMDAVEWHGRNPPKKGDATIIRMGSGFV